MLSTLIAIGGILATAALVYAAVMLFVEADAREMLMAPLFIDESIEPESALPLGDDERVPAHRRGAPDPFPGAVRADAGRERRADASPLRIGQRRTR